MFVLVVQLDLDHLVVTVVVLFSLEWCLVVAKVHSSAGVVVVELVSGYQGMVVVAVAAVVLVVVVV